MADVLALLAAAVIVTGGGFAIAILRRAARRKAAIARQDAPHQFRQALLDTDDYIRQVNSALSEDDLDSLEHDRNRNP